MAGLYPRRDWGDCAHGFPFLTIKHQNSELAPKFIDFPH
jgi:hypothetical protein